MSLRLPSRYEDLDPAFRASLRPNRPLIDLVRKATAAMSMSGGVRFLPIYGRSGSGKSSAARELSTHLPEVKVIELSRAAILSQATLLQEVRDAMGRRDQPKLLVAVVDEYEENVAEASSVPSQFIERLSLLDRGELRTTPVLFLWLTTSKAFQAELTGATSRNERLLLTREFELHGPDQSEWAAIVEQTFSFHNQSQPLADFEVLRQDIEEVADTAPTVGKTIEEVGTLVADQASQLLDLSQYQVVMLWPVTDATRITRVTGFTNARDGYKLNWDAFYQQLNEEDRTTLPLVALNRARLYFDVRLVPIAAADLHALSTDLSNADYEVSKSYLDRFQKSHFFSIVNETWDPTVYSPLRERESDRAENARTWYAGVTTQPTQLGRRIAKCLTALGLSADHERSIKTPHSSVRADIAVDRVSSQQTTVIVELKAFSAENTRPSSIKDAIRTTLKRHAQLAGFISRQ